MKVSVTVDIPDDCEVTGDTTLQAAAWDFPANQIPKQGRMVFAVQVREKWQWPSWLKAAAIAMDANGGWWAYDGIPNAFCNEWTADVAVEFFRLGDMLDFSPPPCTDWRQSVRLNPNLEAKP